VENSADHAAWAHLSADDQALLALARDTRRNAYAPMSTYRVGAAVETADGRRFGGCNVEHIVLGLTCCAEMVAVFKGVSEGCRAFTTVAVYVDDDPAAAPCGSCRQMLHFWRVERVVIGNEAGAEVVALSYLLPHAFGLRPEDVGKRGA
jgi:cytidine deaminase